MELATFLQFQRQLDRAASRADLDDVLTDLKRHERDDPDVSAIGEMIAMLRPILEKGPR